MEPILETGATAWRIEHADRVSFLIDGESYYGAVARALENAGHSVFILGWDVHSRVRLLRDESCDGSLRAPGWRREAARLLFHGKSSCELPASLGARLGALIAARPRLDVYVLDWDFPVLFAKDRETRVFGLTDWPRSERFHIAYDAHHPVGASHHQKLVVIDDAVAFGGGMDIGVGRWDTSEHLAADARRSDPGFADYVPAHDVMLMADGGVARAIGELVRDRWKRATGHAATTLLRESHDCWPDGFLPDATDVPVAISRTRPAFDGDPQILEIETLHLRAIAAAEHRIYIENQYLTSDAVTAALGQSLARESGPEIVVVLPQNNFGFLESQTIQVLHFRRIARLREMDRHGRLRICYPIVPELGETQINLHSKVLVVDDRLLRIGSSNITNRSMRLDTECDFSVEATDDRTASIIAMFRNRLLAEHLCVSVDEVAAALRSQGLLALVDAHIGAERCLRSVEPDEDQLEGDIGDGSLIDPKVPITTESVIEAFAPPVHRRRAKSHLARMAVLLVVLAVLAGAWKWTPLREWIDPGSLAGFGATLRRSAAAPLAVVAVYVAAGLAVFPVTVLILATAAIFGPLVGMAYSLAGSLASAMALFSIGRVAGRGTVERLTGRHFVAIERGLRHRGLLTMVTLRVLPIAPFSIVNIVVGATPMRVRDFAVGTVVGMLPGIAGLSIFQSQLTQSMREPGAKSLALLALVSIAFLAVLTWLRQRLRVGRQPFHAGEISTSATSGR